MDTLGVRVVILVDDGNLAFRHVGRNIGRRAAALVGVGEAELEHVVLPISHVGGGGGRRQHEYVILIGLRRDGDGGACGDGACENLHSPVEQDVVRVHGGLAVGDVVLKLQLHWVAVDAARGVDLVHGDLLAVFDGLSVDSGGAGERADPAELECRAAVSCALGGRGRLCCGGACAAAACHHAHAHGHDHEKRYEFFHFVSP